MTVINPKDVIRTLEKDFITLNKKIKEFTDEFEKIEKDYNDLNDLESKVKISKDLESNLKLSISRSNILSYVQEINETADLFFSKTDIFRDRLKEMQEFLESFRNSRIYHLDDLKKLYKFIPQFLDGYSEYYYFKPEFIGDIDLKALSLEMKAENLVSKIKLKYEMIPKLIDHAYKLNLKNFVIEANGIKLYMLKGYKIKVMAESETIKLIDKAALEIGLNFE